MEYHRTTTETVKVSTKPRSSALDAINVMASNYQARDKSLTRQQAVSKASGTYNLSKGVKK
jgi:hypothetical protein